MEAKTLSRITLRKKSDKGFIMILEKFDGKRSEGIKFNVDKAMVKRYADSLERLSRKMDKL